MEPESDFGQVGISNSRDIEAFPVQINYPKMRCIIYTVYIASNDSKFYCIEIGQLVVKMSLRLLQA